MSLRCLIVDDEPLAHGVITEYAKDIPFISVVGHCYRATEALDFLSKQQVDLIFLDIRMPKLNGLDFLRTLPHKPLVIITSAYEEYALESFDLAVCDYLLKPFRLDRFVKAVNRALELYNLKKQTAAPTEIEKTVPGNNGQISIKADKKHILIKTDEIQYLESLGNYVKVWKDHDFLLTPRTLGSFEAQLSTDFIRIHKSYILNKKYVDYLEGNTIVLKNGREVPIGKNYKGIIKQLLNIED
ncbi:response regulator transcription factor [Pedobacter riviphilus]|uniref:Response regulator transcription factor n=1 Tax=Pedobacter riviphilus TaxID=2766984 RepID=A0ABX6TJY2_9SPHI|nr:MULTISPECIES: LytTR family DNA-binding domain-containing protein [Pedobacter]NII82027.1 DNA-binding LytR/AlgR family response regulator [Pedobacter sp. SG908]NMN36031.1 DNA-binding LytR/AlgR family response regulator [Pedobacter sp. SG918]QNR85837.1 response regulator transcription factor [Pedobacter riviphilus]